MFEKVKYSHMLIGKYFYNKMSQLPMKTCWLLFNK